MKSMFKFTLLLTAVLFVFVACNDSPNVTGPQEPGTAMSYSIRDGHGDAAEYPLWAGQHIDVGYLYIWNDIDYLYIMYATTGDWELKKTHLAVAEDLDGIPRNRPGIPVPGRFPYKTTHYPWVTEYTYEILLADYDLEVGDDIVVAAHAEVVMMEDNGQVIVQLAPYGPDEIVDYWQGPTNDPGGAPVPPIRSDPEVVKTWGDGTEGTFFSLGFGGWLIVGFDNPITNGDGFDLLLVETTWGAPNYPLEEVEVWVSQTGEDNEWYYLGTADNQEPLPGDPYNTVYYFDLDVVGLDWAKYVKVQDISDPDIFPQSVSADGYDVNAIIALHDYIEEIPPVYEEETAWGGDMEGPGPRWWFYAGYTIEEEDDNNDLQDVNPFHISSR